MTDDECVRFLQWALPRLGMRWAGFRKVRRQVCRRVRGRLRELGLPDLESYRALLETHPGEWAVLDGLSCITISRFYRDRAVFDGLRREVVPELARSALAAGRAQLEAWSAGAAGGEEPYTLALLWNLELAERCAPLRLRVLATDADESMLERARAAVYAPSSLKELPECWRRGGFLERDGAHHLRPEHRDVVVLALGDVRGPPPAQGFDLVLCRYLAFTYFDGTTQAEVARSLAAALRPGGALVIGTHEALPEAVAGLDPWPGRPCTYFRRG